MNGSELGDEAGSLSITPLPADGPGAGAPVTEFRRLSLLAEAGNLLASSLDYHQTLARVIRLLVPHLADYCIVYLLEDEAHARRVAVAHIDPRQEQILLELQQQPLSLSVDLPVTRVLRSGQLIVTGEFNPQMLQSLSHQPEYLGRVLSLGTKASLTVPLQVRGRILGAIGLGMADSGRSYGAEDVALAEELASRVAMAVDNARLYQEAQRARDQLRERVEEMETLMETLPVGVFLAHDRECRRITANRVGNALMKMPAPGNVSRSAPQEELPAHFKACRNGVEVPSEELPIQYAAAHGVEVRGAEVDHHYSDGSVISFYGNASPLFDAQGNVRGSVGVFIDVTERKQAEQAIQAAHERIRGILESITDCFFSLDREWRLTDINQRAERVLGASRSELLGRAVRESLAATLGEEPLRQLERACQEASPVHFEARLMTDQAWFEVHAHPSPEGLSVYFRDITERKRAEAALRESEARFKALVDNSPAVIFMKDLEGRYLLLNRHAGNQALYTESAVVGKTDDELFPREVADMLREHDRQVLRTEEALAFHEVAEGKEGPRHFIVHKFALRDGNGVPYAVCGISTEVTEMKRLQVELQRRADELSEAHRQKDEFLAVLAHELRNPLGAISNAIHVLNETAQAEERSARLRHIITHQTRSLTRLVDDLLDVSRLSRGLITLRKTRVDLSAALERAIESCRPLLQERQHQLQVSLPQDYRWLEADPTRLEQIIVNLLSNAAKYTEPGGRIEVSAEYEEGQATLRVRDSGQGIPPEWLQRIFTMFTQVPMPGREAVSGMGIGLAMVQRLVQLHGGIVRASSEGPGRGSEFVVQLPLLPEEQERLQETSPSKVERNRQFRRVVIIDDNADAAETLRDLLELWGHEAWMATDGKAGIAVTLEQQPDLVLLDIGMPEMDGFEVARRLREQPILAGLVLVAMTGYGQDQDRRRTQEAGFDRHMVKPVEMEELRRLLEGMKRGAT